MLNIAFDWAPPCEAINCGRLSRAERSNPDSLRALLPENGVSSSSLLIKNSRPRRQTVWTRDAESRIIQTTSPSACAFLPPQTSQSQLMNWVLGPLHSIHQIFFSNWRDRDEGHAMSQQTLDDQLLESNDPKRKGVVRSSEVSDVTRKKLSLKRKKGFEKDSVLSQAAPDLSKKPKPAEPSASSVVENKNPFGKVTC